MKRGICGHGWTTDVFYEGQDWWFPLWSVDAHNPTIGFRCRLSPRVHRHHGVFRCYLALRVPRHGA